jgi:hypothetical protein
MDQVFSILKKLRGRSFAELRERGRQKFDAHAERRGWSSLARLPGDEEFLAALGVNLPGGRRTALSAESLLEHFRARRAPSFFAPFGDEAAARETLRTRFNDASQGAVVAKARKIGANVFDLLGYRDLFFGAPIDWQLEPVSGKKAPSLHWSRIDYLNPEVVGDKKITWELNRHQYFSTLGRAYWRTGDEHYAAAFAKHLSAWMEGNPPKSGINWSSSLEISFRAISWLWALYFFKDSSRLTPSLLLRALKFLYLHARHLESYLSTYFSPNTHLTGEALGLFYLGTLWPEFKRARVWRELGQRILNGELDRHVRPDGVYFEQSSYYHRYTTDFYLHYYLLSEANGGSSAPILKEKLHALLDHLMYLTKPDGTTPLIGDDDGGRLVMLDERAPADFRSSLATAAALFSRPDYKYVAGDVTEETFWLLGSDGVSAFDRLTAEAPSETSRAFPDGGYYVMRDNWSATANYLVIDCGPHGVYNCGHAHADALSFEVAVRGRFLLVDPGTYTYTAAREMRDYFRSSAAHNTLTIDKQSSSVPSGPFSWKHIARTRPAIWSTQPRFDYLTGAHDGYSSLDAPALHERSVLFLKGDYWIVRDRVETNGRHRYDLNFHFAPDAAPELEPTGGEIAVRERSADRPGGQIISFGKGGSWQQDEGWASGCYGEILPSQVFTFSAAGEGDQDFFTFLVPRSAGEGNLLARELTTAAGRAFTLSDQNGDAHDLLLIGPTEVTLGDEQWRSDAPWVWARLVGGDRRTLREVVLIGGGRLDLNGRRIAEAVDHLAVEWQGGEMRAEMTPKSFAAPVVLASLRTGGGSVNNLKFSAGGRETLRFVGGRPQDTEAEAGVETKNNLVEVGR